ncbi:MAG: hypothetical protein ACRCTP_00275 [Aeromonas popoffii]|uniref:hypothetical protein n=1 Tax=Aeromonas popoffii TaxID=70856 RepID=UPI003F352636
MIYKYTTLALLLMCVVIGIYVVQFHFILGYKISHNTSDWVDFSDFVGGLLGPLLSFLSFVLLLHSLKQQNRANAFLIEEAKNNRKNEKFRVFETHFFNLINVQRTSFDTFDISIKYANTCAKFNHVDGVIKIEDCIQEFRNKGASDAEITTWLDNIDCSEKVYNTLRIFCNIVKVISEKLTDDNGFNLDDRRQQYHSLISLTEFSQLRMVLMGLQFIDCPQAKWLQDHEEFVNVLKETGLDIGIY